MQSDTMNDRNTDGFSVLAEINDFRNIELTKVWKKIKEHMCLLFYVIFNLQKLTTISKENRC